jgi:hypothetical protein
MKMHFGGINKNPKYHLLCFCYSSYYYFFLGLEFELRALHLQSRRSNTWALSPVHFALVIFKDGVLQTICPGWPRTTILWISASQVARTTGMSHQCWAICVILSLLPLMWVWGKEYWWVKKTVTTEMPCNVCLLLFSYSFLIIGSRPFEPESSKAGLSSWLRTSSKTCPKVWQYTFHLLLNQGFLYPPILHLQHTKTSICDLYQKMSYLYR